MEKLPKKVETPKREETKPLQNQAKLEHRETKKVFATQNTQEKKVVVKSETNNFYEKLYTFVREWEWSFQAQAFCDSYYSEEEKKKYGITAPWLIRKSPQHCTYWSIWFGTKSFQWEKITYEEAIKRKKEAINTRNNSITTNCISEKARIIAVDFIYQNSWKSANIMRNYAISCREDLIIWYIENSRDYYKSKQQWWMVKREQKRINYFYNN